MSVHVEWTQASICRVESMGSGDFAPDGQRVDAGNWALMIGDDADFYLVVEGSSAQLLAFAQQVQEAAMSTRRAECDNAYDRSTEQQDGV
jgi:hypothetical protein